MSGPAAINPLALTLGEPAGIGLDLTIAAWLARHEQRIPPFLFVGDLEAIRRRADRLGCSLPAKRVSATAAVGTFDECLPCAEDFPEVQAVAGTVSPRDGQAVIHSIRHALELVAGGAASAVVTNPIHKKALSDIGFAFPGHTEYLAALSEELFGRPAKPVMMIAGPGLRVVPVTIHIPLSSVVEALTTAEIVHTARIVLQDMQARFGIAQPRLAFAGLNPHAGEEGMLGREDMEVIRPAVEQLCAEGVDAVGPLPADTMFHAAARETYDVAICMYHDQALIPVKTLAFDEGVNVTLGLPFIRTSPDHGTALSLAGTGKARPTSLIAALRMADELVRRGSPVA